MSSGLTFPVLPGLAWSVLKTPQWSTRIQTSVNGKELTAANWSKPKWKFQLTYEFLRADSLAELQSLVGFFMLMKGAFDDFFYVDPTDHNVVDYQFATGNGSATSFQLTRPIGTWQDSVLVNGTPTIKVAGTPVTPASVTPGINSTTIVFGSAPANAAAITWTGNYYFRCRFLQDEAEFENFLYQLWTLKKIEFVTKK